MNRKRQEKAAEAVRLYHSGMTRRQAAAAVHVHPSTVSRWLAGTGRRRGGPKRADVRDEEILALREQNLSFQRIAQATGMSRTGARMRYYAITGRERPDRAQDRQIPSPSPQEEEQ